MKKLFVLLLLGITGCASPNNENTIKEQLLISANDQEKLIEFYKLNVHSNLEYKAKLVEAYLEQGDIESADLYIKTYSSSEEELPLFIYTTVRASYYKKKFNQAEKQLERYIKKGGDKGLYLTMLGKIKAHKGELDKAKFLFEESKKFGVSDRDIKNNIAVVNMIGKEYLNALPILYQLYLDDPSDSKVTANLVISSLHAKRFDIVSEVLRSSNFDENNDHIIKQLSNLAGINYKVSDKDEKTMEIELVESNVNKIASVEEQVYTPKKKTNKNNGKYRIQILATDNFVDDERLLSFKSLYGEVYLYQHGFWKRYCIGSFDSFKSAKVSLDNMNIKGAFIVNYKNYRYNIL
ncbi:tetratricopeptide repeat protein [Vibrio caribbeanicus]|uniref:Putative Flp pilus assembly protein TadD n=1 Tax=Vibrio caribbeanicus ATCC BAA-2122 TaxID=796620 RepID=E3BK71_9VIBR|nr:Flp pilus assembly protein TadD [Vibrio caribbeanicus]EFP96456.1 putative Flp pilus assembly protein TadD [Vibrio caribbeanicus ATCC BAA-2122]